MPPGSQNGPTWEEPEQPDVQGDEPLAAVVPPPGWGIEGNPLVVVAEPGSAGQPQQVACPPFASSARQCRRCNAR